jgi:hypothetical protein
MTEPERLASDKKLEEDKAYWAELQRSADAAMDPASRHILRGAVGERNPGDPITAAAANAAAAAAAYASANAGAAASLGAIPTELMRSNGNMGSDSDIKAERIVLNPGSDQDAMARAFANVEKAEQAKLAGHYVGATGDSDEVAQTVSDSGGVRGFPTDGVRGCPCCARRGGQQRQRLRRVAHGGCRGNRPEPVGGAVQCPGERATAETQAERRHDRHR